jgi:hypothetical protein
MCDKTQEDINSWVCPECSDMIIATSGMNRKNRRKKIGYGKIKEQGFYVYRLSVYMLHITDISYINILLNYRMNGKCSTNMAVYRKPKHSKNLVQIHSTHCRLLLNYFMD